MHLIEWVHLELPCTLGATLANQIAKNKKQISIVLTIDQIKRLDGRAAELGVSRNELISQAVEAIIGDGGADGEDAALAKFDAISAKLDAIASAQGELKAQQLAQATALADAIKNQPIEVQQQLPSAEPAKKGLIGRIFG